MKQFRIGRVHEPWANLEPPIRSPADFYAKLALRKEEAKAKKGDKEGLERPRRSRTSVDLSSVGLFHHNAMLSPACAVSVC